MAVPNRRLLVRLCDIQVHLVLSGNSGTYVTAAVKIYAHSAHRVLIFRTHHLYLNLFFILLGRECHITYHNIGQRVALDLLCLYRQRTLLIHEIAEQLHLQGYRDCIGSTHYVVAEVERPTEVSRILIVEIGTVRVLVKEVGFYILTGCKCRCKTQQPYYMMNLLFHKIQYHVSGLINKIILPHRYPPGSSHIQPRRRATGRQSSPRPARHSGCAPMRPQYHVSSGTRNTVPRHRTPCGTPC